MGPTGNRVTLPASPDPPQATGSPAGGAQQGLPKEHGGTGWPGLRGASRTAPRRPALRGSRSRLPARLPSCSPAVTRALPPSSLSHRPSVPLADTSPKAGPRVSKPFGTSSRSLPARRSGRHGAATRPQLSGASTRPRLSRRGLSTTAAPAEPSPSPPNPGRGRGAAAPPATRRRRAPPTAPAAGDARPPPPARAPHRPRAPAAGRLRAPPPARTSELRGARRARGKGGFLAFIYTLPHPPNNSTLVVCCLSRHQGNVGGCKRRAAPPPPPFR